jgi:hydrophobe/amphiphile efflux-3 (HAE3) family protein
VNVARFLSSLASGAARRPWLSIGIALALGIGGAALALGLHPSAAADTFVGKSSSDYQATQAFYKSFGEEPVAVVVDENVQQLVLSPDLERLAGLEGCLSGNVPAKALPTEGGAGGPCGQLRAAHTVKAVIGPGTFLAEAATQLDAQLTQQNEQARHEAAQAEGVIRKVALVQGRNAVEASKLGREAGKLTLTRYTEELVTLGLRYGLDEAPSVSNPNFISKVVFESASGRAGVPKQRFAYLFPSPTTALVSVRMRAGLGEAQRTHTIALIRAAVTMPQWRLQRGGSYLVTGEPAIVSDLTGRLASALALLLVAVALAMALALALVFTGSPRLLPLAVAALAVALTFGALALAGGTLTIAQVAVLPVLVGLSVDYAIQFQSRVEEHFLGEGEGVALGLNAVRGGAFAGGPSIALAVVASMGAFLVLLSSPVPMVRGFGVLLVVGVAIAFVCALAVGSAVLVLAARRGPLLPVPRGGGAAAGLAGAWRGARELVADNPLTRGVAHMALVVSVRRPGRVLAVGLALAAAGWGLDTQTSVQTDITKLVPQDMASLRNLNALERASGVGGEIDMMLSGKSLTAPKTIEWMSAYESDVLKRYGYSASAGCGKAQLCPAFSLPDLFHGGGEGASAAPAKLTQGEVSALLAAIPPYFSQEVIGPDHRTATLAFGIRLLPLSRQQQVIEGMRAALHPPAGVSAQLVGLPVLAAQADAQVASVSRRMLTLLAGLLAVGLILLAAFRGDWRRTAAPLVPVVLATGWSALIVYALRVPLNPMSVTLGTLVIAISTEFSVLLCERQRQERLVSHKGAQGGAGAIEALRLAYARTGAAVAASGVTAIVGFGVLALSDIAMLRDFGIVTLIDLSVSLVGVLIALPASLLLSEGRVSVRLRRPGPLAAARAR